MEKNEIIIKNIDKYEAARYLGYKDSLPDVNMTKIILECEMELLKIIRPAYCYKVFEIEQKSEKLVKLKGASLELKGESISEHLKNASKVVVLCTTLSSSVDNVLRKYEAAGEMVKTLVTDALANAAIEQVCDEAEKIIMKDFEGYAHNFRFGVGYGDFPLDTQKQLLETISAPKQIGVCATESCILTPRKSVTCIIGLSKDEELTERKSCKNCRMIDECEYKKSGTTCYSND